MWIKWMLPLTVGVVLLSAANFYGIQPSEEMSSEITATKSTAEASDSREDLAIDWNKSNPSTNAHISKPNAVLQQIRGLLPQTSITFHDGRLSLSLDKRRLDRVLEEIQNKTTVMIAADGLEDRLISMRFEGLLLDEGLHTLLSDFDSFFFYNAGSPPSLKAIWIYPQGQGEALMPVPSEKWASTAELEAGLTDADAEARVQAIENVIERRRSKSLDAVLNALADTEDKVRNRALYKAIDAGMQLPPDVLGSLALRDPDSAVRLMAIQALAEREADRRGGNPKGSLRNKSVNFTPKECSSSSRHGNRCAQF